MTTQLLGHVALSFSVSVVGPRVGRGWAAAPNRPLWRALSERSELRSHHDSGRWTRHPQGRARAKVVLGPFAETKGPRRAGAKPRINKILDSRSLPGGMTATVIPSSILIPMWYK